LAKITNNGSIVQVITGVVSVMAAYTLRDPKHVGAVFKNILNTHWF
jgi:hypothetical protein